MSTAKDHKFKCGNIRVQPTSLLSILMFFSPFDGVKLSLAHRGSKIFISFFGGLKWEVLSFFLLFEQFSPQLISNAKMEQEDAGDKNSC